MWQNWAAARAGQGFLPFARAAGELCNIHRNLSNEVGIRNSILCIGQSLASVLRLQLAPRLNAFRVNEAR